MATYLNFPFDQEVFVESWESAPDPTKAAMVDCGALVEDGLIASRIQNEGALYTVPFYSVLDGEPDNYDGATDISASEPAGVNQTGVVYGRGKGFTARNFASELSGADPMNHIAATIGKYWAKQRQKALLSVLNAIFGISGASGNAKKWKDNHIVDLSSSTETPYLIGATDLNDLATKAMGDNKNLFSLAIMHSNVAKTLENLQLLEFWKYTDINGIQRPTALASVSGFTVVIDDGVPVESGADGLAKYTTYLLGEGAIRTAKGRVDVPAEVYRDPSKNGGQDTLYTRIRETIHPNGFSFTAPSSGWTNSPTDEQLGASANWSVAFDPKSIPIAKLVTNG